MLARPQLTCRASHDRAKLAFQLLFSRNLHRQRRPVAYESFEYFISRNWLGHSILRTDYQPPSFRYMTLMISSSDGDAFTG